mgnify:CR=1 FL=1
MSTARRGIYRFLDFYDNKRILVVGHTENAFLGRYSQEERERALEGLISRKPPAIIICRSLKPYPEMMEAAKRHGVALLAQRILLPAW